MFKEFFSQVKKSADTASKKVKSFFKTEEQSMKENWTEALDILTKEVKVAKKAATKIVKKATKPSSKKVVKKVAKKAVKKVK